MRQVSSGNAHGNKRRKLNITRGMTVDVAGNCGGICEVGAENTTFDNCDSQRHRSGQECGHQFIDVQSSPGDALDSDQLELKGKRVQVQVPRCMDVKEEPKDEVEAHAQEAD